MNEQENDDTGAPTDEVKSYSEADVQKMIEEQTGGLKSKIDELLGEKKSASQKAKEAEEKLRLEAEQRAKEQNDYKSLFESSQTKAQEYEQKYQDLNNRIVTEKRNNEAMRIANELADGHNAEILSEFVNKRIAYVDDKLVVNDAEGNPTVSTIEDLKKEFIKSGRFDSLLRQSKANGGGASGGSGSGAVTGGDLSKMSRDEKLEYFRQKGK